MTTLPLRIATCLFPCNLIKYDHWQRHSKERVAQPAADVQIHVPLKENTSTQPVSNALDSHQQSSQEAAGVESDRPLGRPALVTGHQI